VSEARVLATEEDRKDVVARLMKFIDGGIDIMTVRGTDLANNRHLIETLTRARHEVRIDEGRILLADDVRETRILRIAREHLDAEIHYKGDDRRYIVDHKTTNKKGRNMSMGRHSGLMGAALMMAMGAAAGPQTIHEHPVGDHAYYPGMRRHYSKGSKCQSRFDRKAVRRKGKAARHARVRRAQQARR
jgi:hypothetical protein